MKKYLIALSFAAAFALILSSFSSSNKVAPRDGEEDQISSSEVWEYMHENVFDKLGTLVNYDKERAFSRCPSGFSQYMDDQLSDNQFVYGTITYAQGCSRDDYCFYKLDWAKKETFLKKKEKDSFVAIDTYVKNEKQKVAKI